MFLSGFLFWNHTHLNSTGKLEQCCCPIACLPLPPFFPQLLGLLLLAYIVCAPVLPGWVVSRHQWSGFGIFLLWSFVYTLMLALPMLLWELSSPRILMFLLRVLLGSGSLVLTFLISAPVSSWYPCCQQFITWLNRGFRVLFSHSSKIMQSCWSFFLRTLVFLFPCVQSCRIPRLSARRLFFLTNLEV